MINGYLTCKFFLLLLIILITLKQRACYPKRCMTKKRLKGRLMEHEDMREVLDTKMLELVRTTSMRSHQPQSLDTAVF